MLRPLAMDSASMNPYEQQLYSVFKTFDVDNEEALNKSAVLDLCDALQLEDRGAALVGTLFERSSDRVTFTQFRNGLLSVLSGDGATAAGEPPVPPAPPAQSDEDSSGREVAPKFVFGSKKYGRRSRPQRAADEHAPRAASVSRLDAADGRARSSQRARCRRSVSAMDSRDLDSNTDEDAAADSFDHDRPIDRDEALALCRNLRMDGIDRSLVDRIFEDSRADDTTTVGEFFDRLNASLTSSIEGAREASAGPGPDDDAEDGDEDAGVASELVAEAWERAGVPRPRRLLLELGFASAVVRPPDLERALDDELAALAEPLDERRDARTLALAAALALARLRLRRARRRADLASAERDKLRADVAEANRRARLLAQDVDESHARMEAELATSLRRAEARHADAARQAAEEAAAERERAAALRARLEAEAARRGEAEARLRAEADAEWDRGLRLEARAAAAEARAAAAEREAERLAEELREARRRGEGADASGGGDAVTRELEAQLEELRLEAKRLRDRNDELCGALEARAGAPAGRGSLGEGTACGDLSAELRSLMTPETLEECDSAPASIEQKVLDYREAARRLRAVFEAVRASAGEGEGAGAARCGACASLADVRARVREISESVILVAPEGSAGREAAAQTDHAPATCDDSDLQSVIDELRKDLADAETRHDIEKQKLTDIVKELETSLEAMREEYERCEEYWAGKLRAERAAGEEEARAGDARLAELAARIADYERRFAPPPLPSVDERPQLEAQVAELERECEARVAAAEAARGASEAELRRLRERLARRRPRRSPAGGETADTHTHTPTPGATLVSPAGAGGACACACAALSERCRCSRLGAWLAAAAAARGAGAREAAALRARAARAEAAVRRLTARLTAADLLVKELYVENCHLAHRSGP